MPAGHKENRLGKGSGDDSSTLLGTLDRCQCVPYGHTLCYWKSARGGKRERTRYARYAKTTFRKGRRLNIRLSNKDLEAIQKRALAEGLPYQTLIASSALSMSQTPCRTTDSRHKHRPSVGSGQSTRSG